MKNAVVVSIAYGYNRKEDGVEMYKIFAALDNGLVGYYWRSKDKLPLIGDKVNFTIGTSPDCKFIVKVE